MVAIQISLGNTHLEAASVICCQRWACVSLWPGPESRIHDLFFAELHLHVSQVLFFGYWGLWNYH